MVKKVIAYCMFDYENNLKELTKGTPDSIGYDLVWNGLIESCSDGVAKLHTGLWLAPYECKPDVQVRSRSGLASKGIWVVNSPGTIDPDYRDEVCVLLNIPKDVVDNYNSNSNEQVLYLDAVNLTPGARIAQLIIPEDYILEMISYYTRSNIKYLYFRMDTIKESIKSKKVEIRITAENINEEWKNLFPVEYRSGGFGSTGIK